MRNGFIYRFFKIGRIPPTLYSVFESEQILFYGEGLSGWMIMRDIRAPGKRFKRKRSWFVGFLVLTQRRLAAFVFGKPVIDVMRDTPVFSKIQVSCAHRNRVEISLESSEFNRDWSGRISLQYKTQEAARFCREFEKLQIACSGNI